MIRDLVIRILYGAVCMDIRAYSDEFTDAMRQLHWAHHSVGSKFTRGCGRVDARWMNEGYATHRNCSACDGVGK